VATLFAPFFVLRYAATGEKIMNIFIAILLTGAGIPMLFVPALFCQRVAPDQIANRKNGMRFLGALLCGVGLVLFYVAYVRAHVFDNVRC